MVSNPNLTSDSTFIFVTVKHHSCQTSLWNSSTIEKLTFRLREDLRKNSFYQSELNLNSSRSLTDSALQFYSLVNIGIDVSSVEDELQHLRHTSLLVNTLAPSKWGNLTFHISLNSYWFLLVWLFPWFTCYGLSRKKSYVQVWWVYSTTACTITKQLTKLLNKAMKMWQRKRFRWRRRYFKCCKLSKIYMGSPWFLSMSTLFGQRLR